MADADKITVRMEFPNPVTCGYAEKALRAAGSGAFSRDGQAALTVRINWWHESMLHNLMVWAVGRAVYDRIEFYKLIPSGSGMQDGV